MSARGVVGVAVVAALIGLVLGASIGGAFGQDRGLRIACDRRCGGAGIVRDGECYCAPIAPNKEK